MSDITQAIELAIRTTGQQTVTALTNEITANKNALAALQAQLRANGITTTEFIERAARLNGEIKTLEIQASQASLALKGLPTQLGNIGPAALQAGYAIDDLQYGLAAVVNNIPGLVLSLGGGAGLAGALGIVAVAANLLYNNWGKVRDLFALGVPAKMIDDVKAIEKELKALTEKTWKTAIDFRDIDIQTAKLAERNKLEAEYQRLKSGKSEAEKKRSDVVSEAITESGGIDMIAHTVAGLTPVADSEETAKERAKLAAHDERFAHRQAGDTAAGLADRFFGEEEFAKGREKILDRLKYFTAADAKRRDEGAKDRVAGASSGNEAARAQLEALLKANPQKFIDRGINVGLLGEGLANASPANLFGGFKTQAERDARDAEQDLAADNVEASGKRASDYLKGIAKAEKKAAKDKADANDRVRVAENDAAKGVNDRNKEIAAEQAKAARAAPKAADAARESAYAREFRRLNPDASPKQAAYAGHEIDSMVQRGDTPNQAYATVREKMLAEIQRLTKNVLEMNARAEQDAGFFGQASMMLQQLNSKMNMSAAFNRRGRTVGQTGSMTFSNF